MKFVCSFLVAAALLSAAPIHSIKLVNGGSPDVSIGPYTLTVDGQNMLAMCIDSKITTNKGTQWNAYISPVGVYSSNEYDPFSTQALNTKYYEEEAYLFSLIVAPGTTAEQRKEIQDAAWDLTNPGAFSDVGTSPNYLTMANNNYSTFNFTGYEVVSDTTRYGEQEFIIYSPPPPSAPEPASYALLGVGLLMAGGLRQWSRRRQQLPVAVR